MGRSGRIGAEAEPIRGPVGDCKTTRMVGNGASRSQKPRSLDNERGEGHVLPDVNELVSLSRLLPVGFLRARHVVVPRPVRPTRRSISSKSFRVRQTCRDAARTSRSARRCLSTDREAAAMVSRDVGPASSRPCGSPSAGRSASRAPRAAARFVLARQVRQQVDAVELRVRRRLGRRRRPAPSAGCRAGSPAGRTSCRPAACPSTARGTARGCRLPSVVRLVAAERAVAASAFTGRAAVVADEEDQRVLVQPGFVAASSAPRRRRRPSPTVIAAIRAALRVRDRRRTAPGTCPSPASACGRR